MATVKSISKSQFTALYNDTTLSSQDIAEKLGVPYIELSRMAKACGMSLRNRSKGKRVIYQFEEETIEETTNDIVEVSVEPADINKQQVFNTPTVFQTIED